MPALNSYRIFPLGDSALTLDFGNFLDENVNERVIALFDSLREDPLPGVKDLVPAYSSLTVFFTFDWNKGSSLRYNREQLTAQLEKRLQSIPALTEKPYRTLRIPVCYDREFGLDIEEVSARNNIAV